MSNNQLVDSCLRVLQDKGSDMPQYTGQSDADYHGSNGQADTHSLHSSHLSVQEDPLLIRTHKQQTSQQVTTVTKVVREVSHMEPDPGAVSYMSVPLMSQEYQHADPRYPADPYMVSFDHYDPYLGYPPQPGYPGPHGIYMPRSHSPHSPHSPSEHSRASPPHEYLRKAAPFVEGGYNDIDPGLNPALQDHYRITPSPGGPGDQYDQISNSWNMDDSGEPSQHPHAATSTITTATVTATTTTATITSTTATAMQYQS